MKKSFEKLAFMNARQIALQLSLHGITRKYSGHEKRRAEKNSLRACFSIESCDYPGGRPNGHKSQIPAIKFRSINGSPNLDITKRNPFGQKIYIQHLRTSQDGKLNISTSYLLAKIFIDSERNNLREEGKPKNTEFSVSKLVGKVCLTFMLLFVGVFQFLRWRDSR